MMLFCLIPFFFRIDSSKLLVQMLEIDPKALHLLKNKLESLQYSVELMLPKHYNLLIFHVLLLLSFLTLLIVLLSLQVLLVFILHSIVCFHLIHLIAESHLWFWSFYFVWNNRCWRQLRAWLVWDWIGNYLMLLWD